MAWWIFGTTKDGDPSYIIEYDDTGDPVEVTPDGHPTRVMFRRGPASGQGAFFDSDVDIRDGNGHRLSLEAPVNNDCSVISQVSGSRTDLIHIDPGTRFEAISEWGRPTSGTVPRLKLLDDYNRLVEFFKKHSTNSKNE